MMEERRRKDHTKTIKWLAIAGMLLGALLLYAYITYLMYPQLADGIDALGIIQNVIYILLMLLFVFTAVVAMFDRPHKFSRETLFLIISITMGIIYLFMIPLMVVPDEYAHMLQAYDVSNDMMGIDKGTDTIWMRTDDIENHFNDTNLTREDYTHQYEKFFSGIQNAQLADRGIGSTQKPRYLYCLTGIGITIGRLLGCGTALTFMLARVLNLAFFLFAVNYAVRRMPFAKGTVMVWACLPITLQQAASMSYDSPILALSILVISSTMNACYGGESDRKKRVINWIVMGCSCLLLLPCKSYSLFPLALLPCMLLPKLVKAHSNVWVKLKEKEYARIRLVIIGVGCLVMAALAIVVVHMLIVWLKPENAQGIYIDWAKEEGYSVGYCLRNPVKVCGVVVNTLLYSTDEYLLTMLGGSLGWLEMNSPYVAVLGFLVVMIYASFCKEKEEQVIHTGDRIWMTLVSLGVCALVMLGMLLYWTPLSAAVVNGIQGRYFLPVLVLMIVVLRTKKIHVSENADYYAAMWTVYLQLVVVTYFFRHFVQ